MLDANAALLGLGGPGGAGCRRCPDARPLSVGGRIFWETHLAPLLLVEAGSTRSLSTSGRPGAGPAGAVSARAGSEHGDALVRVAVARAGERVRYEQELRAARAAAEGSADRVGALQQVTAALGGPWA